MLPSGAGRNGSVDESTTKLRTPREKPWALPSSERIGVKSGETFAPSTHKHKSAEAILKSRLSPSQVPTLNCGAFETAGQFFAYALH